MIARQTSTSWSSTQRLQTHQSFNAMQTAGPAQRQDVMPNPSSAVRSIAGNEAPMDLAAQDLVVKAVRWLGGRISYP